MADLVKIDPKEFGLEENQVSTIEAAFLPKIQERDGYLSIYGELLKKEITPQTEREAKELRLKLVKVRTGIADIHKTQKAFFLAAGRFVDAWKNKETAPIEQMEENLQKIELYSENIRKEKIAKLETERKELVLKFSEVVPTGLGSMDETVFNNYLTGLEIAYNAKIEAEKKAEAERLAAIEAERIERERIKAENERLRKEAEENEKQLAEERAKAEAEAKKQAEILAKQKAEADAKQREIEEKARIEREVAEAEQRRLLQIEREKQAKLEAELKSKRDAEIAEQQRKEAEEKARIESEKKAEKAPDKVKLQNYINSLSIEIPVCKTIEAADVAAEISAKFTAFKKWANSQIETL